MTLLAPKEAGTALPLPPGERPLGHRPIRVMVVDDSAVVRGLVSLWIEQEPGLDVVARHANGKLAVDDVARSAPDVVLLDVEMPVMDGLEALPLLLKAKPGVRVLLVSTLSKRNAEISFKPWRSARSITFGSRIQTAMITISPDFHQEVIRKIKALGRARTAGGASAAADPAAPARRLNFHLAQPAGRKCWDAYWRV